MDGNREVKLCKNSRIFYFFFGVGGGSGWGGQDVCEWRSEAFVKIKKTNKKKQHIFGWGSGQGGGVWLGGTEN